MLSHHFLSLRMQRLINHISRFVELNDEEKQLIANHLVVKTVKKKTFLLNGGDICKANHFVLKGCMRMYFIKDSGQEQIVQFGIDDWWITDYGSLESQRSSTFFIQALENSEIVVLNRAVQQMLFERVPKLERYFRLILQRAYSATLIRLQFLFDQSAAERYHHFNNLFPGFVQRIPQYILASYLNITPEVLSKIRAAK